MDAANRQLLDLAQDGRLAGLLRDSLAQAGTAPADLDRAVSALCQALVAGDFSVDVQLRSGSELQGAMGAFTASGPDGRAHIYLNADWVQRGQSASQIERVLLEEMGHAFDQRVHGGVDTRGDEGALFAALATGHAPTELQRAALAADVDRTTLVLDGVAVSVELAEVSVPFNKGFIGTIGANSNQADGILTLASLGIDSISFYQDSSTGVFTTQGNDIPGGLRILNTDGSVTTITGAINWRHTQGSTLYSFGFIPDPTQPDKLLPSGYLLDASCNYGLELVSATYVYHDGDNISGNAATSGLLTALNNYLSFVQANDPNGPVTVTALTTSDTTPTITGSATVNLAAGEYLSVQVNGVTYVDGDGHLTLTGSTWVLNKIGRAHV